jgi:hypothetical protein
MDTDTPLDRKAIITDPVSKETLTTEEILVLVDSLPIDGKHISNEVLGSRKLSLHGVDVSRFVHQTGTDSTLASV